MKDWQEILRLYEKDNLYLAEAAQMLNRNITYEVPSFKKQIQKFEQSQNELDKKQAEYKKSENTAQSEFTALCKQLGIPGKKIKRELVERIIELPEIYDKFAKKAKSIENVIEFYSTFVQYTLGRQHDGGCVPMVKYICENGNVTTYEWTYGEPPLSIMEPPLNINFDDEDDNTNSQDTINEIDFGESAAGGINLGAIDADGAINFGDDVNLENAGDIDWGNIGVDEVVEGEIDFNVSLEESGIVVEDAGNDGGTATGNDALTILDNPATRNDFIDQLFELEAFLKLRLYELQGDSSKSLLTMSQFQEASPLLQLATLDSTQSMLDNVQVLLTEILDSRVQHLHNVKHSPRYVDVLTGVLKQKLSLVEKMVLSQKLVEQRIKEAREQALALQPMLKLVIQRTKELQIEIEQDISKKYKNRVVRLTGGVHTL
ncbi:CDK5RAP3-like protein isoform X2 [Cephus cinctus]|nr:CDK5RAP3-like protein isoform X2 [Cephus cinctus]